MYILYIYTYICAYVQQIQRESIQFEKKREDKIRLFNKNT